MAINLTTAASRISANAAAVATAMAGGTTTAEATAISQLLAVMALRPSEALQLLKLVNNTNLNQS